MLEGRCKNCFSGNWHSCHCRRLYNSRHARLTCGHSHSAGLARRDSLRLCHLKLFLFLFRTYFGSTYAFATTNIHIIRKHRETEMAAAKEILLVGLGNLPLPMTRHRYVLFSFDFYEYRADLHIVLATSSSSTSGNARGIRLW